ncbi:8536_t:CDS:2 [Diversispora eburnea]|uniref:8536_t:CDS:1 n=1 Tax=Diversispora eburnea TaxID=1213867 RepID=A0A9N8V1S4_9GLOM|nr:8536_t:CDS:2 [Diversispora eburnea]
MNWAKDYLNEKLVNLEIEHEGYKIETTEIIECSGDADLNQRKGKFIPIIDLEVELKWKVNDDPSDKDVIRKIIREKLGPLMNEKVKNFGNDMLEKSTKESTTQESTKKSLSKTSLGNVTTIKETVELQTSADQVYETLLDPGRVAAWTRSRPDIFRQIGTSFSLFDGNITGTILELVPNEKIVQKWRLKTWPEGDTDLFVVVLGERIIVKNDTIPFDEINVTLLKEFIREERDNIISSYKMVLWKVEIEVTNDNIKKLKNIKTDIKSEFKGVKLKEFDLVNEIFSGAPPEEHINIIVQLSSTTDMPKNKIGLSRLGGLGGTLVNGVESGMSYEGVDLKHIENICQRKETINRLLNDLEKKNIILIRSPPMTGKTSLAQLLEYSILESEDGKVILIVDEAQVISYPQNVIEPRYGGSIFWNSFKGIQQLKIVAFSVYGYYGTYTDSGHHSILTILPQSILSEENTWGFADQRFTIEEFKDYFNNFCKNRLQILKKESILPLCYYVGEITAFHPGLVTFTMNQICEKFIKWPSLEFDDDTRACPQVEYMSKEEKKIADKVLFNKSPKVYSGSIPNNNNQIIMTYFLVDIKTENGYSTLNFPAPLLRAIYFRDRFGYVIQDFSDYLKWSNSRPKEIEFKDFLKLVFTKMYPMTLQNSRDKGEDDRLFERVWKMEFYCASIQVLPMNALITVDVGKVFGSTGYVDFYINEPYNWIIELLRDEEKMIQHQQRFQEGDISEPIFKHIKQWAIIDIRNSDKKVPKPEKLKENNIYVHCAENFEFVQLIYPNGNIEDVQLLGEENRLGYDISEFLDSKEID